MAAKRKKHILTAGTDAGSFGAASIALDINGSGAITVTGINEDAVWDIVSPKLKAAFMGILREEIFEEGDNSYGF